MFTLHAELEGGAYLPTFEVLLQGWQAQGYRLGTPGDTAATLAAAPLPHCAIERGLVPGRTGLLAVQGRVAG